MVRPHEAAHVLQEFTPFPVRQADVPITCECPAERKLAVDATELDIYNIRERGMEFRWIDWNIDKLGTHEVQPEEAEFVVEQAAHPHPQHREDDKFLVWGPTAGGRLLQVVFLLDEDDTVLVIHARPLTDKEKRRRRKREG